MDGVSYHETNKQDSILVRSVRKTSQALSKPYIKQQPVYGQSVGFQAPSKSKISYVRSVKL